MAVEDLHQLTVSILMPAVLKIQTVQDVRTHGSLPISRASNVPVQGETVEVALAVFLKLEGKQPAQKRAHLISPARATGIQQEVAPVVVPAQGHDIAAPVALDPSRVILTDAGYLIRREELQELLRPDARGLDHPNDIVRRGQTHHLRTAIRALCALEANRLLSHSRYDTCFTGMAATRAQPPERTRGCKSLSGAACTSEDAPGSAWRPFPAVRGRLTRRLLDAKVG